MSVAVVVSGAAVAEPPPALTRSQTPDGVFHNKPGSTDRRSSTPRPYSRASFDSVLTRSLSFRTGKHLPDTDNVDPRTVIVARTFAQSSFPANKGLP